MLVPAASRELATLKDTPTWRALLLKGDLPAFLLRCEQAGHLSRLSASDKAIVEKARQDSKTSTTLRPNPFADLANWVPDEHPRWPKGTPNAGEFMPEHGGAENSWRPSMSLKDAKDFASGGAFPNTVFYHHTNAAAADSISKGGFRPSDGAQGMAIYLTEAPTAEDTSRNFTDTAIPVMSNIKNPAIVKGRRGIDHFMEEHGMDPDAEPAEELPKRGYDAIYVQHFNDKPPWLVVFDPKSVTAVMDKADTALLSNLFAN